MLRRFGAAAALTLAVAWAPDAGAIARFCTRTDVSLGTNGPHSVVAADFYGLDGVPDLAVTFQNARRLVLYRNDGLGNFTPVDVIVPPVPDTGSASDVQDPAAIVAADFNADGWPDIAGTNRNGTRYFAYLNPQAAGGWTTPAAADARRGNGTDMETTSWDGDAALDLVIGTDSGQVGIALGAVDGGGNPTGTWGAVQRFTPTSLQVGVLTDVEAGQFIRLPTEPGGSNLTDVLAVDNQYNQLVIWPGDPLFPSYLKEDALVSVPVEDAGGAPLSPLEAFVEDWSGDGLPDALVVTAEGVVLYYRGNGAGTVFDAPVRQDLVAGLGLGARMPTEWTAAVLVDIVGGPERDLVIADAGEPSADRGFNWLTVIPGTADAPSAPAFDGAVASRMNYALGNLSELKPGSLAIEDFDGDGSLDIVALHGDASTLTLLRNDGTGRFDAAPSVSVGAVQPRAVASGRLDADSRDDVAVVAASPSDPPLRTAIVLRGTGPETLSAPVAQPASGVTEPVDVFVASVNDVADPILDIAGSFLGDQVLWPGRGDGTFGAPSLAGGVPGRIDLGDLAGTASLDIAAVEGSPISRLTIWEGDGRGGFALRESFDSVFGGQAVLAAKLFGGARADVIVSGTTAFGEPGLYACRWDDATSAHLAPVFASADALGIPGVDIAFLRAADLDQDGTPEVLGVASSGEVYVFDVSGTSLQIDFGISPLDFGGSATGVVVRDLTGDGKLDIAVSDRTSVRVRENQGGTSWAPAVRLLANISTQGLAAADLDGDGRPELIALGGRTGDLTVFCNQSLGSLVLRVGKDATAGSALTWLDQGAGATYGVASGSVNEIWRNADLRDASCLATPAVPLLADPRALPAPSAPTNRAGYYYLVKCEGGDCTEPTFGETSDGRPRFGAGSPGGVPDLACP